MEEKFKIFSVPFDPAHSPERLSLKMAYILHHQKKPSTGSQILDPYDIVKSLFGSQFVAKESWIGKIQVESWLSPRPQSNDLSLLTPDSCDDALKNNICWKYALKTADFVEKNVFPSIPIMIGIDHSTTGGVLFALAKKYENLNLVILDAHFDAMRYSQSSFNPSAESTLFYECGNFLDYILEKEIIRPENLWVLGVDEQAFQEHSALHMIDMSRKNMDIAKRWINQGVHIFFKQDIASRNLNLDLNGPTYLSIDMDIGSLSSIFTARYMTSCGLNMDQFKCLLEDVDEGIKKSKVPLIGIDIMEMDIHLLDIVDSLNEEDHTKEIIEHIFKLFLKK